MANRLQFESSPYLLQHADNPVDWYPYGEEAFVKAKAENKPILFSIGYSACHWCHVMEHESFEDESIARIMNEKFVCVKVDREERPDVDHFYMDAVQLLFGHGGWPLNCFTLPDGRPYWGGTYFRPEQWKEILQNVSDLYISRYKEFEEQALEVTNGIIFHGSVRPVSELKALSEVFFNELFFNIHQNFDANHGGMTGRPKFPMPMLLQMLMHYSYAFGKPEALDHVLFTLRKMAQGGIYDQVGGGFARYSVDGHWKLPHFEKMLYDNAQLVSLYSNAYKISKDESFREIIEGVLLFIRRELTSPEGVFYSSLDADSDGEEGLFYTWSSREFMDVLGHYGELMGEYYGVGLEGEWEEGKNILLRPMDDASFAQNHFLSEEELRSLVKSCNGLLLEARDKRNRPGMDDKVLLSWNALMIKAYIDASISLGKKEYLDVAVHAATFILEKMKNPEGGFFHTWKNGTARIPAFLDDYSFLAETLLLLYQYTMDSSWLMEAEDIVRYIRLNFTDTESDFFCFAEEHHHNVIRKVETNDSVIPSSNSSLSRVMHAVGTFIGDSSLVDISSKMLEAMNHRILNYPLSSANWACVAMEIGMSHHVIAISGKEVEQKLDEIGRYFIPNALVVASATPSDTPYLKGRYRENETLIHICTENACFAPVDSVDKAVMLLGAHQGLAG